MSRTRGSSLAELMVACALFSVFMTVSIGLFTSMTRIVRSEQRPAEQMTEARAAALKIARRIRNCQAFVSPALWQVVQSSTDHLMLRDGVLERTVEISLLDGVLTEIYYPMDHDPQKPDSGYPIKGLRLTAARSFRISGGGVEHPTRFTVEITTEDGRQVRAVSNLREAI